MSGAHLCCRYTTALRDVWTTVSILHNVSEMRRKLWVGGLRTVGPSAVRVPGGTMPQKSRRGFPSPQAARMVTSARFHLQEPVVDSGKVGPTMPPGPGLAVGSVLGHYRRCDSLTFRLQPTRYDEASQSVGKCLWPMDPRCIACMLNAESADMKLF